MRIRRFLTVLMALVFALGAFEAAARAEMPYRIDVDLTNQIVTVYDTSDDSIVRQFICSSGTNKFASPKGTFKLPEKVKKLVERSEWYPFEEGWARFATRIKGQVLFHSYLFISNSPNTIDWSAVSQLGVQASHGCVRLYIQDAEWICSNCEAGTSVKMHGSDERKDYLRQVLCCGGYSRDSGISYSDFTGIAQAQDELGYGSEGDGVREFQTLLIEKGLYAEEADGVYDERLVRTVRILQRAMGMRETGKCTPELLGMLDSDRCPQSMMGTYSAGSEGAGVSALQAVLKSLGLYGGEVSGVFDALTEEAVRTYQRIASLQVTGTADPALLSSAMKYLDDLEKKYGESSFALFTKETMRDAATVAGESKLNVRAKPNTESTIYDKVLPGEQVTVLEKGEKWSRVKTWRVTGWLMNQYLTFSTVTDVEYSYGEPDADHPALAKVSHGAGDMLRVEDHVYAKSTAQNNLIARFEPKENSVEEFKLPNTAVVRVLGSESKYTRVVYGEKEGYVLTRYLKTETVTELADPEMENEGGVIKYARIKKFQCPYVYAGAKQDDEQTLTELIPGTRIGIMEDGGDFIRVRYRGFVGYVPAKRVTFGEETVVEDPVPYEDEMWDALWKDSPAADGGEEGDLTQDEAEGQEGAQEAGVSAAQGEGAGAAQDLEDAAPMPTLPPPAAAQTAAPAFVTVNTGSDALLNLRAAPASDGKVLRELENGTALEVLSDMGDWMYVTVDGVTGYVMAAFVIR